MEHVALDTIIAEGRGLVHFVTDGVNTIEVRGAGFRPSDLQVILSNGDVLGLTVLSDALQVAYCVRGEVNKEINIEIRIAGCVHSVHTVRLGLSSSAATAYFMSNPPVDAKWSDVLFNNGHDRAVLLAALWFPCGHISTTRAVFELIDAANRHPVEDLGIQLNVMYHVYSNSSAIDVKDVQTVVGFIYAAMDAHSDLMLQAYGCSSIGQMWKASAEIRSFLLDGRAVEVCRRAADYHPHCSTIRKCSLIFSK